MTRTSLTRDQLEHVGPTPVAGYLRNHGWTREETIEDKADVWRNGEEVVVRPIRQSLRDYTLRLAEVIATLGRVENRSGEAVLEDVLLTNADVLRLRFTGAQLENGQLPLTRSAEVFDRTTELLSVAACAAVAPRAVFGPKRPDEAVGWVSRLRLAPTEAGSVVLKIVSDTTAELEPQSVLLLDEQPFERRAMVSVLRAVEAAVSATGEAAGTASLAPFERSVARGVSANLCEALAALLDAVKAHSLSLEVGWSTNRAAPPGVPDRVIVGADAVPVLRGAGQALRARGSLDDFELQGFVVELKRQPAEPEGTVTVHGTVLDQWRRVRMKLGETDYETAVLAHQRSFPVRCLGTLVKAGRGYELQGPREFCVIELGPDDASTVRAG